MFRGVGTAIITPFTSDYEIDYEALKRFLDFQLEGGIQAVVVLGTTGEAPAVEFDEREALIKAVVEQTRAFDGEIPVIVGTGSNNTKKVIKANRQAEESGADGLLIVTPYYNKSNQEGLYQHYRFIAGRTALPIIMYNVPSRTGCNMLPETVARLADDCPNIVAMKEASGDISQIARLAAIKPDGMKLYSGNDDQALPVIALGGDGVISVFSNVNPGAMNRLAGAALENDYDTARKLQREHLKIMGLMFSDVNPIPVKYAVSQKGYCEDVLRLPLVTASDKVKKMIDEAFEETE